MIARDHKFVVLEARLALAEGFEHRPVQPAKKIAADALLFDPRRERRDS